MTNEAPPASREISKVPGRSRRRENARNGDGIGPASRRTIRDRIVEINGYERLRRELLEGELERFRGSLEWIERRPDGSLLDIGARGDLVPVYRADLGYARICCLDAANETGPRRLIHADGSVHEFDSYSVDLERDPYPFDDESFDQVVAMEVIEHLAADPMFMLAEANRVLKPGGRLLLTTPNITSLSCLYNLIWSRHPALGKQAFGPDIMDRHHREYTPSDITGAVEAAGFTVHRLDTFDSTPVAPSVRRVRTLLRAISYLKPGIDLGLRNNVIRCDCVKAGPVAERFPENLYPRYRFYDYAAYDRELVRRFGGRRYWQSGAVDSATPD